MKIGIILGFVLGIVLLIVGGVAYLITNKREKKCKWCTWVALAGACALITAVANAML